MKLVDVVHSKCTAQKASRFESGGSHQICPSNSVNRNSLFESESRRFESVLGRQFTSTLDKSKPACHNSVVMPCRTEYPKTVSNLEIESRIVAGHLCYLFNALKQEGNITDDIKTAKDARYGNVSEVDNWTALLCKTIRSMSDAEKDAIVYNGKKTEARALADWWERHQAWDKKRKAQERKEKIRKESDNLTQQFQKLPIAEKRRLLSLAGIKVP